MAGELKWPGVKVAGELKWPGVKVTGEFKWPGSGDNHSSPSSVEFGNEWSRTYTPLICLQGLDMENLHLPLHWQFV